MAIKNSVARVAAQVNYHIVNPEDTAAELEEWLEGIEEDGGGTRPPGGYIADNLDGTFTLTDASAQSFTFGEGAVVVMNGSGYTAQGVLTVQQFLKYASTA